MKKIKSITILTSIMGFLFYSCETNGTYEVKDVLVPTKASVVYMQNPAARYQIDFDNIRISDSLPYFDKKNNLLNFVSKEIYIKQNEEKLIKIWRLGANGSQTLESATMVNSKNGLQLLQMSDNLPLTYYIRPQAPPADKTTQTNVQFFYADTNQPDQVKITILAVEYLTFLIKGQNFDNLSDDKKKEIASFDLKKGDLSSVFTLDLDFYKEINKVATGYYYKITNTATGTIIQDYNKLNKIIITAGPTPQTQLFPKFKTSLFKWSYTGVANPFMVVGVINGENW